MKDPTKLSWTFWFVVFFVIPALLALQVFFEVKKREGIIAECRAMVAGHDAGSDAGRCPAECRP